MNNSLCEYIGIAIICLVVAFIIGTSLVSVIDSKINNVSVNLPEFNIPKPNITVLVNKEDGTYESFSNTNKKDDDKRIKDFAGGVVPHERLKNILVMDSGDVIKNQKAIDLYGDVERGLKEYAVAGCKDRRKKFKMYPNQVSCNFPNNLTAENYYTNVFQYPYIPGPSEELYFPSNYDETDHYADPNKSFRIVNRNAKIINKKPPYPSNYWFKR